IVAFKDKAACDSFRFPDKVPLEKKITDIINTSVKVNDRYYYASNEPKYARLPKAITDRKQLYRFSDWGIQSSKDGIAFTLKANMGTYPNRVPIIKDKFGIRNITPAECLALQGFSSTFTFPDAVPERERYKQAGNTVCVNFITNCVHL
ncbi:MAG: DNA (cytosine-5-)-methyltransferase, partial [Clostridia bacterium]|nr:DNA (cytosine-5-)-methyltransferase [Clostridia bacterium]